MLAAPLTLLTLLATLLTALLATPLTLLTLLATLLTGLLALLTGTRLRGAGLHGSGLLRAGWYHNVGRRHHDGARRHHHVGRRHDDGGRSGLEGMGPGRGQGDRGQG